MHQKEVAKLSQRSHRKETGLFLVEGEKNTLELLESDFVIEMLFATKQFLETHTRLLALYEKTHNRQVPTEISTEAQLIKMGTFLSNNAAVAVAHQKSYCTDTEVLGVAQSGFVLALDDIRDPGNLGTIIRTADWYGVTHIVASPTTVDFYNSKVITATMGSYTRMRYTVTELLPLFHQAKDAHMPIVTADMTGESLHTSTLPKHGFLVMGSESHGVHAALAECGTQVLTIPKYGGGESLNVSIATAVILDALKR
jgi:RNA methyltransferase, TrmH family